MLSSNLQNYKFNLYLWRLIMGITDDIKDTARKVTHTVVDKTQEVAGITKSPSELAKRMIEHLTRAEYKEAAHMLTVEVKKYVDKMDLSENAFAMQKLKAFEDAANSVADDLERNNYNKAVEELEKLTNAIPNEVTKNYKVFDAAKHILQNIIDTLKKHIKNNTEPEFNDLISDFEDSFKHFADKNK